MEFLTKDKIQRGPKCNVPLPDGMARYVFGKLREYGEKVAQVYLEQGGLQLTYHQLWRRSAQAAVQLRQLGLRPGDVLGVATMWNPHYTPLLVGSFITGVVIAPFNPNFDQDEIRHVLAFLRPRLLLADKPNVLYEQSASTVLSMEDVGRWFDDDTSDVAEPETEEPALDSPAIVLCSSGTTGYPKGVEISHRGLLQLLAIATERRMMKLGDGSFLVLSPAFWVSAVILILTSINAGGRIVAMPQFNEPLFLKSLREHKVVATIMSLHMGIKLLKMSPQPDLSPLRFIVFGGSLFDPETKGELQRKFRLVAHQVYGMTEVLLALNYEKGNFVFPYTVGVPLPSVEVKVVDTETGDDLCCRRYGELCFRGPMVTRGYYNDPVATAAAIDAEGWFHTGDVGYYGDASVFYITDRIKDFIKYKGNHVPSSMIEATLYKHPAVLEAAVVGVPDPLDVELPRAYVVLKTGEDVSAQELVNFANNAQILVIIAHTTTQNTSSPRLELGT